MSLKQILEGHYNELTGREQNLSEARMSICKVCPLYKESSFGPICNPALYLNPNTGEAKSTGGEGFYRGCSCRLNAKTRSDEAHCPANKW